MPPARARATGPTTQRRATPSAAVRAPLGNATNRAGPAADPVTGGCSFPSGVVTPAPVQQQHLPVGPVGLLRHSQGSRQTDSGNSPARLHLATLASSLSRSQQLQPTAAATTPPTKPAARAGALRFSSIAGGAPSSPTRMCTNMSLDSALMGGLLAARNPYLIPPLVDTDAPFVASSTTTPSKTAAVAPGLSSSSDSSIVAAFDATRTSSMSSSVEANATGSGSSKPKPPPQQQQQQQQQEQHPRGAVTVVWDLDETLCCNRRPGRAILRPGALEALRALRALSRDASTNCFVEVVLWTASMECVARPVVDRLDPHGEIFNHLIFRDRRWYKETGYTKDLRLLGRDMSKVVIIENSPMSVHLNRKHAILVRDFMGSANGDRDLFYVKQVLEAWIAANGAVDGSVGPSTGSPTADPPGIVDFLAKHPAISHSNEIVARANLGVSTNSGYVGSRFGGHGVSATSGFSATSYFGGRTSGIAKVPTGTRASPVAVRAAVYARR